MIPEKLGGVVGYVMCVCGVVCCHFIIVVVIMTVVVFFAEK